MPLQNFGDRDRQINGTSLPENRVNTPALAEDSISPLNYERRLQTARSKFGCGCTNCISTRQQVKSGELAI